MVESYRTAGGSRQRIVAYIGELKDDEQSGWVQLGRRLDKKSRPLPSLFDPPHYDDPTDEEPLEVNLRGVRLERLRDFGDVWLALVLWRFLGLDKLLYDVTSTYFEGECRHNPMAKHGYSRDNRPDCLQVCIGLVVAKDWHEIQEVVPDEAQKVLLNRLGLTLPQRLRRIDSDSANVVKTLCKNRPLRYQKVL